MKSYINADALLDPLFIERERRDDRMETVQEHVHNFYELYFLADGKIDKFVGDRTYHLRPLDLIFISPNTLHKSLLCQDYRHERIVIYFDERTVPHPHILQEIDKNNCVITLSHDVATRVFKLMNLVGGEKERDAFHDAYVSSLLCEMLVLILRNINSRASAYAGVKFEQIIDYVRKNCLEALSLTAVAKHFYISDAHLSRLFRRNTGFTFTQYINYQRIIHAQNLLANNPISVGEVATRSGFENLTHFGRVFKQLTGVSPRDYKTKYTP